jgi:exodeoxyribonuclease VII large subunit
MDIIFLNCPFQDKELAKQKGARWNPQAKKWYVTRDMVLTDFQAWLPDDLSLDEVSAGAAAELPPTEDGSPQFTIRQFVQQVQQVFYQQFSQPIWLVGQITRLKPLGRGHSIELIDQQDNGSGTNACCLTVNAWGEQWSRIQEKMLGAFGQELAEGMLVRLLIQPEFHPRYHLGGKILDIDPAVTLGEFALMQQKLKAQLQAAGILHTNRELPAPVDFCRVAVIHPQGASGYHDFKSEADKLEKLGLCQFVYFASRFEGDSAEQDLLKAFNLARDLHLKDPLDALVLIRGGGSRQGLLNLIKYPLLEQICTFPVPVITGLGHADDVLLIEEVSCLRRDTPSKAVNYILNSIVVRAQHAVKSWQDILIDSQRQFTHRERLTDNAMQSIKDNSQSLIYRCLQQLQQHIHFIYRQTMTNWQQLQSRLRHHQQALFQFAQHFRQYQTNLDKAHQDILMNSQLQIQQAKNNVQQNLNNTEQQCSIIVRDMQQQLSHQYQLIEAYDPGRVLERGYTLIISKEGKVLSSKQQAQQQPEFNVKFHDGELSVTPQS